LEAGGEKVKALQNRPMLDEQTVYVWQMFCELHQARTYGYSANPISFADMGVLFDIYQLGPETQHECFELIQALDAEWLKQNAKLKEESINGDTTSSNRRQESDQRRGPVRRGNQAR